MDWSKLYIRHAYVYIMAASQGNKIYSFMEKELNFIMKSIFVILKTNMVHRVYPKYNKL